MDQVVNKRFFLPGFKRSEGCLPSMKLRIRHQFQVRMLTVTMGRILILGLTSSAESLSVVFSVKKEIDPLGGI